MNNYNINYEITYDKHMNDEPDTADLYYRKDLLEIFGLDEDSDFDLLSDRVNLVYKKMKEYIERTPSFKEILEKAAGKLLSEDIELGFMILHSYDTLYLMHQLNSEFLNTNQINNTLLENIKEKI